jgi:thiamine biosynthesis protein ThiI
MFQLDRVILWQIKLELVKSMKKVLVRYGEIGLKGKNRDQFVDALARNIKNTLRRWGEFSINSTYGRIYVTWDGSNENNVMKAIASTFGVVSISPVRMVSANMDSICQEALVELKQALTDNKVNSFKVSARRSDKSFPHTSLEINQIVGAFLLEQTDQLKVDVSRPDLAVYIEVRHEGVMVYSKVIPGPGGLPVGVSSKALLLISGGIDSPVAGYFAMKRGIQLEAIHFHSFPYTSERALEKVKDLCKILAKYMGPIPLHIIHFTEIQRAIQSLPASYRITVMRRFMFRIAEITARQNQALALVTGESVGQVASQTLESMTCIEDVVNIPVLRPLVAMDKSEIVAKANEIGTYETSILPYEDCCTIFVPKHPQTKPQLPAVRRVEEPLDIDGLTTDALSNSNLEIIKP